MTHNLNKLLQDKSKWAKLVGIQYNWGCRIIKERTEEHVVTAGFIYIDEIAMVTR